MEVIQSLKDEAVRLLKLVANSSKTGVARRTCVQVSTRTEGRAVSSEQSKLPSNHEYVAVPRFLWLAILERLKADTKRDEATTS